MSDFDLLVRSEQDIGISDGKIVAIGANLRGGSREEIDATKMSIFPGVIDAHVHFNEPGRTDWEGFETGSKALAAGGATMFFDMPLDSQPATIDAENLHLKLPLAPPKPVADLSVRGGCAAGTLDP